MTAGRCTCTLPEEARVCKGKECFGCGFDRAVSELRKKKILREISQRREKFTYAYPKA